MTQPQVVTRQRYCDMSGIKQTTLRGWIDRRLERGKHYVVHGRTTMINVKEMDKWLLSSQSVSGLTGQDLKSGCNTKDKAIPKPSSAATQPQILQLPGRFALETNCAGD